MKNILINHAMPLNGIVCYNEYKKWKMSDEEYRKCWCTFMEQHLKYNPKACTCDTCMENNKVKDDDRCPCGQYTCWARAYARQIAEN